MTKTRTGKRSATKRQVDLAVLQSVYDDAMERLKKVQEAERAELGASRTTLADVGRQAILTWRPAPGREYELTQRSPNGSAPARTPFRFYVAVGPYAEATSKIHESGLSITQVVEEALVRFAQTGR